MYPVFKFACVMLRARRRDPISLTDKSVIRARVGLTDTDMFLELNNARYLSYMELGRWDYSVRVGFYRLMRAKRWGITAGGASMRFRRKIPLFARFSVGTQLLGHDGRWIYFLQEFHRQETLCASGLIKIGIVSRQGLVPTVEIMREMDEDLEAGIPDWVQAWIDAEGQRPWPKSQV